jgi:hypothetical protein
MRGRTRKRRRVQKVPFLTGIFSQPEPLLRISVSQPNTERPPRSDERCRSGSTKASKDRPETFVPIDELGGPVVSARSSLRPGVKDYSEKRLSRSVGYWTDPTRHSSQGRFSSKEHRRGLRFDSRKQVKRCRPWLAKRRPRRKGQSVSRNEKEWADDNGSRCSRQKRTDDEYLAR